MSDRFGSYPPDEPVIGATFPPRPPDQEGGYVGGPPEYDEYDQPGDEWDADSEGEEQWEEDEYYEDEYYDDAPARQPMFYVFIGMAALIGGIVIFLLFSLLNNGGKSPTNPGPVGFKVLLNSPVDGQRIPTGQATNVVVQATSTQPITKFELFLDGQPVASQPVTATPPNNAYSATLSLPALTERRNYKVFVRVTASSGATKDSSTITVVGIQPVGNRPVSIQGKVIATVNVRSGPGDNYSLVQTLDAGQTVTIIGKTSDSSWLLINLNGEVWVKRSAISEQESLALVPVTDPTPVPQPTATNTAVPSPSPSPSPSVSPTPNATLPDFLPAGAVFIDGGSKLRITIANNSNNAYNGPLVVAISGVSATASSQAFEIKLPAAGNVSVDFNLNPPVTTDKAVTVTVDPDNAVAEQRKDNNTATFTVKAPIEQPALTVTAAAQPNGALNVIISNSGGDLATTNAVIKVTLGATTTSFSTALAIKKGGSQIFNSVQRPAGTGTATVEVDVGGQPLATTQVILQ